jgi:hypothetical protein
VVSVLILFSFFITRSLAPHSLTLAQDGLELVEGMADLRRKRSSAAVRKALHDTHHARAVPASASAPTSHARAQQGKARARTSHSTVKAKSSVSSVQDRTGEGPHKEARVTQDERLQQVLEEEVVHRLALEEALAQMKQERIQGQRRGEYQLFENRAYHRCMHSSLHAYTLTYTLTHPMHAFHTHSLTHLRRDAACVVGVVGIVTPVRG